MEGAGQPFDRSHLGIFSRLRIAALKCICTVIHQCKVLGAALALGFKATCRASAPCARQIDFRGFRSGFLLGVFCVIGTCQRADFFVTCA